MKEKIQNIFKKYKKEILIFSLPFLALVNLIFTYQTGESLLNKLEAIPNYYLSSDLTSAGQAAGTLFTAISSTGFSVGASNLVNQNTNSFVAWNWKEDPASGFDMLTYTGTGVAVEAKATAFGVFVPVPGALPLMMMPKRCVRAAL